MNTNKTSDEAKQRAANYMSLKGALEPKQTAIEWLYDNLKSHFEHDGDLLEIVQFSFEQAKEKEKDYIRSAYMDGQDDLLEHCCRQQEIHFNSLHYYQRTFKK
jgi:hypothetical protein